MATICPTVLAKENHTYRTQLERVTGFTGRIHIDLADGDFASKTVAMDKAWLPDNTVCDIHLMYKKPADYIEELIKLKPNLVIVHAEAEGHFADIAQKLHDQDIKAGVALLADTPVSVIEPSIEHIDHVLIFSGNLGHFGGAADLKLLSKVDELRKLKHNLEIGWDGGINEDNAERIASSGIDVLNVGGYIQRSDNPEKAYAKLESLI